MDVSKYTEESKNKVRGLIISELEQVEDGERIFLPVDLMESLIFKKYPIKIPIWTGPFLRKIDLSKVDFTDTCYRGKAGSIIKVDKEGNSTKSMGIDLSYTNAKIDFSVNPFERNDVIIDSCNFEGLDDLLTGPTAVVLGYDDYLEASKIIYEYAKDNEFYKIKGGIIDGKVV